MSKEITGWKWRNDQNLTMKEFYNLPQQEKDDYILQIEKVPAADRSSMDIILLNRFGSNRKNNYFTLED
jgi:hypothetical protein